MRNFESYESSLERLKNSLKKYTRVEKVAISDVLGRILAQDIISKTDQPSFATSSMDGYALNSNQIKEGATFKILTKIPAGKDIKDIKISGNECVKTFTGSLMCQGSDTLVPIENVEVKGEMITIKKPVPRGFAVREVGESYKKGEILIKKGTRLSYSEIALLAELGHFHISVFIKPKVAILATGSEIVDLGESLENNSQIRSSNHIALAMMMRLMGCEPQIMPIAKDEAALQESAILEALSGADMLITTGGVSVGDYDFIKKAVRENFEIIVDGAAIKPGRHIKIAKSGEKYIFALPGFPYSAMVMCVLYVREILNLMFESGESYEFSAILEEDYIRKSPFLEFAPANLRCENGVNLVSLDGKKEGSSAIINNLNQNAVLLVCPIDRDKLSKGEVVKILKMP